ncbi:MAG: signal peptide peptidase SppA [Victivallales bacterium]|nr:signal peptide peptidase SppA [Victivallales bacterium]
MDGKVMPGKSESKGSTRKGCVFSAAFVAAGLLLCVFAFVFLVFFSLAVAIRGSGVFSPAGYSGIRENYESGDFLSANKIAVIDIAGVISSFETSWTASGVANSGIIVSQIRNAALDGNVKALVLRLNTPGGEVSASDEIHHELKILREETGKPVVSYMGTTAASGGVYVAVASDYIVANKHTTTGSIGVIAQVYNYLELFKKVGLHTETYSSGNMKDFLSGSRERTEEEIILMQKLIDEIYNDFVRIVAEGRPALSVEDISDTALGDGRILSGSQALEWGLVDSVGYFEDAVEKAAALASLGEDYKVVSYSRQIGIMDILGRLQSGGSKLSVELPGVPLGGGAAQSFGRFFFLPADY